MCGRYTVAIQVSEAAAELRAANTIGELPARFNVAPTNDVPITIERPREKDGRRIGLARFGLVPADSEGPQAVGARYINLRAEGVATQRAFAESAARRRCLVLADGFYEWKDVGAKKKEPWFFRPVGGGLVTFAGIWDIWKSASGERIPSFAILTTKPSALVGEVHDRMPLIVPRELRDLWLSPEEEDAKAVLRALRDAPPLQLEAWRVSPRVGSVANDDLSLAVPIDAERRSG